MAKIREHSPPVAGWCIHCHQRQLDGVWPSQCVEREDWLKPKPGSEPAERVAGCENGLAIRVAITRIRDEEAPKCPKHGTRLYTCLRSSSPCPYDCPLKADWIGPNEDGKASC